MKLKIDINLETYYEITNIDSQLFYPLKGFMNEAEYHSVVNNMRLINNLIWTIPITFSVSKDFYHKAESANKIFFIFQGIEIGYMEVESGFIIKDIKSDCKKVFGTDSNKHPGVKKEKEKGLYRLSGKIKILKYIKEISIVNPNKIKDDFKIKGWKTIAGFQTRNPIHKAHEYHQRTALEMCDGLLINPLTGWKKKGDFSEEAIVLSYKYMLDNIYPKNSVYFSLLKTPMRYAGPREAVFHGIVRKNMGCTHFIVGRDHAGVGNYYKTYEAQDLIKTLENELPLKFLLFKEPYYCKVCDMICTDNTCKHNSTQIIRISGTEIREKLKNNEFPNTNFVRKPISEQLIALGNKLFIQED